jgi:hypothetical protein
MLTIEDIKRAGRDERWLGWGYLGERSRVGDPVAVQVEAIDQRVIDFANEAGWDYEQLFAWCNSKLGRWFGDVMFGSTKRFDVRFDEAVRSGLLARVEVEAS